MMRCLNTPMHSIYAFLVVLTITAGPSKSQEADVTMIDVLRGADVAELPAYTLQVRVEQPVIFQWPEQGVFTQNCRGSRGPDGVVLLCEAIQLPAPVYQALGTGNYQTYDYDPDGNLVVCMNVKYMSIWSEDRNEDYLESRSHFVNPQGAVVTTGQASVMHRYPATDDWGPPTELPQIWMALGQGMSARLQMIEQEHAGAERRKRLRVRGTTIRESLGIWDLIVEPSAGNLIRSASLQLDNSDYSIYELETKGHRSFGSISLPVEGFFRQRLGPGREFTRKVMLEEFSLDVDHELFEQVRSQLDKAASNGESNVIDYRNDPSNPTVTRKAQ